MAAIWLLGGFCAVAAIILAATAKESKPICQWQYHYMYSDLELHCPSCGE